LLRIPLTLVKWLLVALAVAVWLVLVPLVDAVREGARRARDYLLHREKRAARSRSLPGPGEAAGREAHSRDELEHLT
jgi:hypothetical protein